MKRHLLLASHECLWKHIPKMHKYLLFSFAKSSHLETCKLLNSKWYSFENLGITIKNKGHKLSRCDLPTFEGTIDFSCCYFDLFVSLSIIVHFQPSPISRAIKIRGICTFVAIPLLMANGSGMIVDRVTKW